MGFLHRHARQLLALLIAAFCLLTRAALAEETASKPNIVLILADDLGYKDVGFHGSEIKTPNIDALANAGVKLEQFYAMPLCSPTRACLMTGRYPMRQGLQRLVVYPWSEWGLPLEERTLPQALKEAGYESSIVGKWHLGHFQKAYLPMQRGFDHQYGLYNGAMGYYTHEIEGGLDWHRDQKPLTEKGYSTELIGAEAVHMIEQHDPTKPIFLYIAFNCPHEPLQAPKEYLEKYADIADKGRRTFAAMVACMDDQIGKINAAIAKRGFTKNTIVIFMSDNGGPTGSGANNGTLKGSKGMLYEGGMRVPCSITWPGTLKPGVSNEPLHCVDWYPTLLKRAGVSTEQKLKVDGLDLWPVLTDSKPSPHSEILHNVTPDSGAIRVGDWKLVINARRILRDAELYGPIKKRKKGGTDQPEVVELFNMKDDPGESKNLASTQPDKVKELRAKLVQYGKEAMPPKCIAEPANYPYPKVWDPQQ